MSRMFLTRAALAAAVSIIGPSAIAASPPSYAVVQRIKGPDGGFDLSSFDPVLGRVYVARTDGVLALDVATGAVNGRLAPAERAHAAIPVNDGAELLITDAGTNSAHLVDARTGALLADVPTGQKPDAAVFDPASGLAMVMNGKSGDITVIDPKTRKSVGSIPVGGSLEGPAVDGSGRLYITIEDQNRIAVVDTKARALVGHYALPGCEGPTGMVLAPEAGVLIAACANKVAKVIRASDGAPVADLPIGAGPDQAAYDPVRKLAFIPCGRDGVMEVIAVRGPSDVAIVQSVPTQIGARGGAVDPSTGKVYLPTARYSLPPGGGRPVAAPGSFEILVVAPAS
jgi:YVTN family beta-propeller protein